MITAHNSQLSWKTTLDRSAYCWLGLMLVCLTREKGTILACSEVVLHFVYFINIQTGDITYLYTQTIIKHIRALAPFVRLYLQDHPIKIGWYSQYATLMHKGIALSHFAFLHNLHDKCS